MALSRFSQSAIEQLGYYVYALIDPRDGNIFYVGKGKGNRIFQHVQGVSVESNNNANSSSKDVRISEIEDSGLHVGHVVLRHGLSENEALEVEGSCIDLLNSFGGGLTNIIRGHDSGDRGKMTLSDIVIKFNAPKADITEPTLLININDLYQRNMSADELYASTRMHWRVNVERARRAEIVCPVYVGIIREVYIPEIWIPSEDVPGRFMFEGVVAPSGLREKYVNTSVSDLWSKKGSRQPLRYVNID